MMKSSGSVRVDLLGGTLDLPPINSIIPNAITINCALNLKAEVEITLREQSGVEIISQDYNSTKLFDEKDINQKNLSSDFFGPFKFVMLLLNYFNCRKNIRVSLKSGSPPGAGLGGSSSMGVVLFKALANFTNQKFSIEDSINVTREFESIILNKGPAGYQDYYPALYGGILGLIPIPGKVHVEQLYNSEIKTFLEKRITLVYSGKTRLSGINNWEVYKGFFDHNKTIIDGLNDIANYSEQGLASLKSKNLEEFLNLIHQEGLVRASLFPDILSPEMESLYNSLKTKSSTIGMNVCGAGGGGCFLLTHHESEKDMILHEINEHKMENLVFQIAPPLIL